MNAMCKVVLAGCVAALCAGQVRSAEALKTGDRIVFLGDSITAAGVGKGGFVDLINKRIGAALPDEKIEVIGAGISGNKVPDLQRRLEKDVLAKQPTIVVIYIGVNDAWHWGGGRGTKLDAYEAGLKEIIGKLQAIKARVILCTPAAIGEDIGVKVDLKLSENRFERIAQYGALMNAELSLLLDDYAAASRKVAKETGVELLDLRQAFVEYLKTNNKELRRSGILTSDGVHLSALGNRTVADLMADQIGVPKMPDAAAPAPAPIPTAK